MMKITFLVVCLVAFCIEFQEISACLHEAAPCEKVMSCKTDEDCSGGSGGQCQGISSSWPNTGKCSCRIPHRRMDNMKGPYLMENLFAPENLYKIAGAIHKEIHEIIDGINKKFDTAVRGVEFFINSVNDLMNFFMDGTSNFIQILWREQILRQVVSLHVTYHGGLFVTIAYSCIQSHYT